MAQRLIAQDAIITIAPAGADDGTFSPGSAVTLRFRSANFLFRSDLVDVTAAGDPYRMLRIARRDFVVECEGLVHTTNGNYPDLTALAFDNALARLTCTLIGSGRSVVVDGIIERLNLNVAEPDTESLTLRPYGIAPILT
ncbi:MAG: hypothetical protein AMXMBFR61_18870 [Fimbriimonadales bacterium]